MKQYLLFFTLSFFSLTFVQAQNVGIGTSTPTATLDVNSTNSTAAKFNAPAGMYISLYEDGAYRGYLGSYAGAPEDIDFGTGILSGGKIHLTIQATPKVTVDNAGRVGIGTTSPSARLELIGGSSSSANSSLIIKNSSGDTTMRVRDNGYVGIGYNGSTYGRPLNIQGSGMNFYETATQYGGSIFPNNGNMVLWAPSDAVVLQPTSGSVVLGSYTPAAGYKLSVKGKLMCEEARVQLSGAWPDYVFADEYELPTLQAVEASIKINKHLPNMPPAAEVAKNGFDLGDMNKRLLEKVEELTLYIIQLKKDNDAVVERLNKIETKSQQSN